MAHRAGNNEVRIIGGQWKGRKLKFPTRPELRPTLGRVRETLFNWLVADIHGARCLDLFAGSGALGFEALSRGAAEVTFVDQDRKAAEALERNLASLGGSGRVSRSLAAEFLRASAARGATYDVIFVDPPFESDFQALQIEQLLELHLAEGGLVYLERPRRTPMPCADRLVKQATAGDCRFGLIGAVIQK
jgi:16S rRNA (guanine966-N2)-methyltransferase